MGISKSEMKRLACQRGSYRQLGDTVIVHPLSDEERAEWEVKQELELFSRWVRNICPHCSSGNTTYMTDGSCKVIRYCNHCSGGTWQ